MKTKSFLIATLFISFTGITFNLSCSQTSSNKIKYQNPIIDEYLADPCVIYEDEYYYLFATGKAQDGRGIQIYKSSDLVNWQRLAGAVEPGETEDWNWKHFWAPEVIKIDNKFYLYYTASPEYSPDNSGNRVGAAVADNVEGPYKNFGVVIPHASIDGHPFIDNDGQMYMYYTIEHGNKDGLTAGQIYMDKMTSFTSVEGKPVKIFDKYRWQEGPFVQHIDNTYMLTFSEGGWGGDTYKVLYAVSDSPYGPFKEKENIIIKTNEMVKGPGHHSLFKDKNGHDWIVYHGWDPEFKARYPRIDPIYISADTIYCNGPTYTLQEVEFKNQFRLP
jgi:beta-xylosidase